MKPLGIFLLVSLLTLDSCHRETYDERVVRQTTEYNQTRCPQRMDQYTILDSMHYDASSRTMSYYYSIQGEMDKDSLYHSGQLVDAFRKQLDQNIRSSLDIKDLKDHETTFLYIYTSESTHHQLMMLKFVPKDYK